MIEIIAIFIVGLSVGFLNGFAGGASVLSFPAMIAVGLNPVTAAMTNALGVWTANVGALFGKFKDIKGIIKAESQLIGFSMIGAVIGGLARILLVDRYWLLCRIFWSWTRSNDNRSTC